MKKNILLWCVAALSLVGLWLFLSRYDVPSAVLVRNGSLLLPVGEAGEERSDREAWERRRYADPATGRIPEGIAFLERRFAARLPRAATERGGKGEWTARGPWNVGGRTRALALDVNNEKRILAGGVSGGLWLSEDAGAHWERRTPLDAHPGCVSIAQDTRAGKTHVWYYLSGEIYGTSASGGSAFYLGDGLFKSTDNGLNWSPVTSTAGGNAAAFTSLFQGGWRVVTDPASDTTREVLVMATVGGIWRSANGGATWTAVRGGNINSYSYFTDVAVTSKGIFYATLSDEGPHKGIWRSTDGINWTNITPANFTARYRRIAIGINPNDEDEVWFLGETPGFGHYNNYIDSDDWSSLWKYRYRSDNGAGANDQWEERTANMPNTGTEFDRFACQGGYDLVVKVQPGTNHVFIGGACLYRSTDGFSSPNNTTQIGGYKIGTTLPFFEIYPNQHPDQHDLVFLPSDPKVAISASDGGLHRTDDCLAPFVTWNPLNNGYLTTQFYTAIIDRHQAGDGVLIGGLQDNGNFFVNNSNPQSPWRQTVNGDGAYGHILRGKSAYLLSIQQGKLVKCTLDPQGNVTAFRRFDPIGPKKGDYEFINPFAVDPSDENILYQPAGRFLYRQNDLAGIPLNSGFDSIAQGWSRYPDSVPAGGSITAITVSQKAPAHRIYFGTSNNRIYRVDNAHTGNPTFTLLPRPISNNAAFVSCFTVDPDNGDRVLLLYSNYGIYSLFLSENAGQTWRRVAGNLEENLNGSGNGPSLRWISMLPQPGGRRKYFCGTSVGLYSTDTLVVHTATQKTNWVQESPDGIGSTVVSYVDTRPADGLVVAATHGNGMFTAQFDPAVSVSAPFETSVVRTWPNPARTTFFIEIPAVSASRPASVTLYDLQGRPLFSQKTGDPVYSLPVETYPRGVYLYTVQTGKRRFSGKVCLE